VHYVGDARRIVVSGKPLVAPSFATISGPTSDLTRVSSVRVDVPLPNRATTFDEMVRPTVADEHGTEIAGLAVTPNLMRVVVKFAPPAKSVAPRATKTPVAR
jgi:YbbR domain-containing protein